MCTRMYQCVCTYVCVCVCVRLYISVCMYVRVYVCICVSVCISVYERVRMCIYVCLYTNIAREIDKLTNNFANAEPESPPQADTPSGKPPLFLIPKDDLRAYAYEGEGSLSGSLSSATSSSIKIPFMLLFVVFIGRLVLKLWFRFFLLSIVLFVRVCLFLIIIFL